MKRASVFLSYARDDGKAVCDYFSSALQNARFPFWRDLQDLAGGADWKKRADEVIRRADVMLLFLTGKALESEAVTWEWQTALNAGKRIVVFLKVPKDKLPRALEPYNYRALAGDEDNLLGLEAAKVIGDCQQEWDRVENSFNELSAMLDGLVHTPNGELFKAASDSVRQKLNADPPALPPEVFEVCFDLLRQLGDWSNDPVRLAGGLEEIIGGVYKRGGWEREQVFVQQREIFQKLMTPLRSRLRSISVPIVLLVMKKGDAARLSDGTAFDALPPDLQAALREDFASFKNGLADDWPARYGDTPDAWHPFETGGPTVGQMVRQALGQVEGCPDPLLPKYIDLCSLADNAKLTKDLRKGCVLIIDTVSTRYPALQQCFRSSSLDASGMTLVVKVGPDATPNKVAADMKTVVKLWFESSFDWRLREFDSRVAGVNDRFALDSWLVRELPQCLPKCMARTSGVWGQLNQF